MRKDGAKAPVRLYTDVEQTIKEGAQALDRLIRDIVVEQRRFDFSTPGDSSGKTTAYMQLHTHTCI